MNKTVKKIAEYVNEIVSEFDVCDDTAMRILEAAAGGVENVVDWLEENVNAKDEDDDDEDECDCDDCSDCCDSEPETVDTYELTTDARGRITLPKKALESLALYVWDGYDALDKGITVVANDGEEKMEIAVGVDALEPEEGETVQNITNKSRTFTTIFGAHSPVVFEVYDDGRGFLFRN